MLVICIINKDRKDGRFHTFIQRSQAARCVERSTPKFYDFNYRSRVFFCFIR